MNSEGAGGHSREALMGCSASIPQADAKSTTTSGVVDFLVEQCAIPEADAKAYARELAKDGVDVVSSLEDLVSQGGPFPSIVKQWHLKRIQKAVMGAAPMGSAIGEPVMGEPVAPMLERNQVSAESLIQQPAIAHKQPSAEALAPELLAQHDALAPPAKRKVTIEGRKPNAAFTSIDLCIMMDCTGSMHKYMNEAKDKIEKVMVEIGSRMKGKDLRIAFVGYRDFDDGDGHVVSADLNRDSRAIRDFIAKQKPTGGGDAPEDGLGGLDAASKLSWGPGTNLIVWFADAPCHNYGGSTRFHRQDIRDDHTDKPDVSDQVLKRLTDKRVDIHFVALNDACDMTYATLEEQYKSQDMHGRMWQHAMKDKVSDLLPTIVKTVQQSVISAPPSVVKMGKQSDGQRRV